MFFDVLFAFFLSVINFLFNLLPNADEMAVSAVNSGVNQFRSFLSTASFFLPVNQFLSFLRIIVAVEVSFVVYKFIRWIVPYK